MAESEPKYFDSVTPIIEAVSKASGLPAHVIKLGHFRRRDIVAWRHIAMYLSCRHTFISKEAIAKGFGGTDGSTVYYAYRRVNESETRPEVKLKLDSIKL